MDYQVFESAHRGNRGWENIKAAAAAAGLTVTIGPDAPAGPVAGTLWCPGPPWTVQQYDGTAWQPCQLPGLTPDK